MAPSVILPDFFPGALVNQTRRHRQQETWTQQKDRRKKWHMSPLRARSDADLFDSIERYSRSGTNPNAGAVFCLACLPVSAIEIP